MIHLMLFSFLQRALFDEGCIYGGVPPLYKVCLKLFFFFFKIEIIALKGNFKLCLLK